MNGEVLRVYKKIHTWTGIIAGLFLFIAFFGGALTMFKGPLDRWATPPAQQLATTPESQWEALIAATLQAHPKAAREFTLHLDANPNAASLTWTEYAQPSRHHTPFDPATYQAASLDAQGGQHIHSLNPGHLGELVDLLHRTAGIPGWTGHDYWGVYALGAVAVLYALALFSGLILVLPSLLKDLFSLRREKNHKRFWVDLHNLIGITNLPFHIVIALTVIVFAFHDYFYAGLSQVVYGDRPLFERGAPQPPRALTELQAPSVLLTRIQTIAPEFQPDFIQFRKLTGPRPEARVAGGTPGQLLRGARHGFVILDPFTGEITNTDYLPGHQPGWIATITAFFALHFGNYGGALVHWLYFLLGLGGALLFYTGNLLWITSRIAKKSAKPRPEPGAIAALTVGVCWGSVAAVAVSVISTKSLHGLVDHPAAWHLGLYYGIFLAAVGWAFAVGAARALVHLLWLCSAAILAIPLFGVLAAWPGSPWWMHPDTLGVEATALVLGLLFALGARWTTQTLRHCAMDSLWYLAPPRAKENLASLHAPLIGGGLFLGAASLGLLVGVMGAPLDATFLAHVSVILLVLTAWVAGVIWQWQRIA